MQVVLDPRHKRICPLRDICAPSNALMTAMIFESGMVMKGRTRGTYEVSDCPNVRCATECAALYQFWASQFDRVYVHVHPWLPLDLCYTSTHTSTSVYVHITSTKQALQHRSINWTCRLAKGGKKEVRGPECTVVCRDRAGTRVGCLGKVRLDY